MSITQCALGEAREQISRIVIRKVMALLTNDKELFDHDVESLGLTTASFSNNVADAILMEVWPIAEALVEQARVEALSKVVNDNELLEIGRKAIENMLIEWRDSRLSVLRGNGLVVREKDGKDSSIIRFGPETALKVGLNAILQALQQGKQIGE